MVDMTGHETHYCQETESDLLGGFEFQGTCNTATPIFPTRMIVETQHLQIIRCGRPQENYNQIAEDSSSGRKER